STRKPYNCPGWTPCTYPCQILPERSGSFMRLVSFCPSPLSNRHSSTVVAFSVQMAKFTPSPSHVAPSGKGFPENTIVSIIVAPGRIATMAKGPSAQHNRVQTKQLKTGFCFEEHS